MVRFIGVVVCVLACSSVANAQESCFRRLDNGVDLSGWHVSTTNHHGPGAGWAVEGGLFTGRQTGNALGGILMTDALYSDAEVVLDVKLPWGCDSGLFFRTTSGDRAYQVTIDHLPESGVGGIYGESFFSDVRAIPYFLTNQGTTAVAAPGQTPSFDLAQWGSIWHPTEFNEIRARIEGNPPHIQVWIAGLQVANYTDTQLRAEVNASGPIAIQVHGGAQRWVPNATVQFRNIRVKDLKATCVEPGTGGAGGAGGASGAGGGSAGSAGAVAGADNGGAPGSAGQSSAGGPSAGNPSAGMDSGMSSAGRLEATANGDSGCGCSLPNDRSRRFAWPLLTLLALGGLSCRWRARRRRPTKSECATKFRPRA